MSFLFFSLIPIGLIILIYSVRLVHKILNGTLILDRPILKKSAEFTINSGGDYSIWHKGQFFRKAPLDEFKPVVINKSTGQKMALSRLLLRFSTNNGKTARTVFMRLPEDTS